MTEATKTLKIEAIRNWIDTGSINIFGLPFSGKDTHGQKIADILGCPIIGGGDILRSETTPQHIRDLIATGALANTDDYLRIVLPYFSQEKLYGSPLVLSSVGRWEGEETPVINAAKKSNHPIKAALYLDINEDTVRTRWKANKRERHDDKAEHILDKRFEEFRSKTLPVLNTYDKLGILIIVDGKPPIAEVEQVIIDKLYELTK